MSTALASARRRRAGPDAVAPGPGVRQTTQNSASQPQTLAPNMTPGLTLPQVIDLVDKRLIFLENFVQTQQPKTEETDHEMITQFSSVIEEYNSRFDIIADELASMKDTILKLQTYTMGVNKILMEDLVSKKPELGIVSETPETSGEVRLGAN